ncbi:MAG: protein kinase [Tabrizicola sp.]|nr:protein kinase [Tabrizicola sp.]
MSEAIPVDVELELTGDELTPGTTLSNGNYTIVQHLKSGGFGITYLALDTLGRKVVVKECFPSGMCARPSRSVRPRSRSYTSNIASLVEKFVAEAHALARVNHANVVKVHQVFRENETAYMALDYVEGDDLLGVLADPVRAPTHKEIRSWLIKLLDATAVVHEAGLLHRDISPDNILIDANRQPVLIDFGAAREQGPAAERAASTLHVVKDGYSPQELYLSGGDQGPWSDLYALAATFHHLITGQAPPNSQERLAAMATQSPDPLIPLAGRFPAYDAAFLAAIDKAMSVLPRDRLQSARQWLSAITESADGKVLRLPVAEPPRIVTPMSRITRIEADAKRRPVGPMAAVGAAAALATLAIGVYLALPDSKLAPVARQQGDAVASAAAPPDDPSAPADSVVPASEPLQDSAAAPAAEPVLTDVVETSGAAPVSVSKAEGLVSGWQIALPFTASNDRPSVVGSVVGNVPDWLAPGVEIVAVNGSPVASISDIPALVAQSADPKDAVALEMAFTVVTESGGDPVDQVLDVPVVHDVTLSSGARFAVRASGTAWRTEVVALPSGYTGDMQVGDIVVAHVETNTPLNGPSDMASVLSTAIAAGSEATAFAVQRGGSMWVVSLPLPG